MPYTESAATTTATASAFEALRGASYWTDYYHLGSPLIPGAWTLVTSAAAIAATGLVTAVGLCGLARRIIERLFLVATLSVGVAVIAIGYSGSLAGPFSHRVQVLLQGNLAPLRSVAKFSPDVALPIALGLVWLVSTLSTDEIRSRPRTWSDVRSSVDRFSPDFLLPVTLGAAWIATRATATIRGVRQLDWANVRSKVANHVARLLVARGVGNGTIGVGHSEPSHHTLSPPPVCGEMGGGCWSDYSPLSWCSSPPCRSGSEIFTQVEDSPPFPTTGLRPPIGLKDIRATRPRCSYRAPRSVSTRGVSPKMSLFLCSRPRRSPLDLSSRWDRTATPSCSVRLRTLSPLVRLNQEWPSISPDRVSIMWSRGTTSI